MKRCKYCGKQIEDSFEFCKSKCKENYKKAGECDSRKMKYFISGMALGFLVLFCGVCAGSNTIMGTGIVLMGIMVILLSRWESIRNIIANSRNLCRYKIVF